MKLLNCIPHSLFILAMVSLYGCGSSTPQINDPEIMTTSSMKIRTFDLIQNHSGFAIHDVIAQTHSQHEYHLLKNHALSHSSQLTTVHFNEPTDLHYPLAIDLLDRNLQVKRTSTQINIANDAFYWVFAIGDVTTGQYSLYAMTKPEITPVDDSVPLFIVDTTLPQHSMAQLKVTNNDLSQQTLLLDAPTQINLPMDIDDFSIEVKQSESNTIRCENLLSKYTHLYREEVIHWQDGQWLVVVSGDEKCSLHLIY
ncbi:hypothetical protein [Vibrio sp. 10N]|uniref:hypothetical protein n=1 Tax=Vibrio sp. 10N TaxID=3058938 RepID=UPI0028135CA1|nr:hypothetical protein VB10N_31400 [Vibrio sp. 10N]